MNIGLATAILVYVAVGAYTGYIAGVNEARKMRDRRHRVPTGTEARDTVPLYIALGVLVGPIMLAAGHWLWHKNSSSA